MKCRHHNLYAETRCSWCGDHICKECLSASGGKKYCPICAAKLNLTRVMHKSSFAMKDTEVQIAKTRILNIDPTLKEEHIKRARELLQSKEHKKKRFEEG